MFGYLQAINTRTDLYIKDFGNYPVSLSQRGYDPTRRDLIVMRSIKVHFGDDCKLLWLGDYCDVTVSHAQLVFGDVGNYAFIGTNVGALARTDSTPTWMRAKTEVRFDAFQEAYNMRGDKDKIVLYMHEPAKFIHTALKREIPASEAWQWIKDNVTGPLIVRMDCKRTYDGLTAKGPMYYIPYERKLTVRYLLVYGTAKELDWVQDDNETVAKFIRGFNFITRAHPLLGKSYDAAVFAMMSQAEGKKRVIGAGQAEELGRELCDAHGLPVPEVIVEQKERNTNDERWEARIRAGPLYTGTVMSDKRQAAVDLAWRELIGLMESLIVSQEKLIRGCC
ncbi:structural protein [Tai Forest reovirus]|uniref:Structural protein n=1 Tax=Tai Forest reovirus TaxID=2039230 RepID=A0A291ID55_9REOV|nr:structural protein [Tai Forest reovirus]ATG88078.1 structural protein [Tai Forest reovirus]